jgi:hypothetical protein
MNFKVLAPVLLALAGTASAALPEALPLKLPTTVVNTVPLIMPGITLEIIPLGMPGAPSNPGVNFPAPAIKPLPLKLPTPGAIPVVVAPVSLPVVEAAVAVQPAAPAKELPIVEARALNELRDAVHGREPIRMNADKAFDGRRETGVRAEALPSGRIF